MPRYPQELTGPHFAARLSVFFAAIGVVFGVQLPFLPVWLDAKGLDARTIGIVLAVPMIVRVFAIPMAAREADRRNALRAVIVIGSIAAVAGYSTLGLARGTLAIMAAYAFAAVAFTPVSLLADVYALRGLAARGLAYGPVRLWASAGFVAANFGAGYLLDVISARDLIWLVLGAVVLTATAACALAPLGTGHAEIKTPSATVLLRDPAFLAAIAAASLVQASHAVYYGFSILDWQAAGLDGAAVGALWALGVLAEIALFASSARLPPGFGPTALLLAGSIGAVVRWTAMAFDPPAAVLPALQCLHALSFGATHLGALGFVARAAPVDLGATAQGYLGVALGLVMAASMGLSGALYGRYGGIAYAAMALLALAGAVCALAAHRLWRARTTV